MIAAKIRLPREGELLHQFEGFMELQEIDVLKYRDVPGLLQKAYGWEEINRSQVLKQADVVMLLYLLGDEFTLAEKRVNWDFYEPKTMHDSSLSAAIHSIVANDIDLAEEAYAYFQKAARIDLTNSMGNTHAGLHAASLGVAGRRWCMALAACGLRAASCPSRPSCQRPGIVFGSACFPREAPAGFHPSGWI